MDLLSIRNLCNYENNQQNKGVGIGLGQNNNLQTVGELESYK